MPRLRLRLQPLRCKLLKMTNDELHYASSRFVCEVPKQNGEDYPAHTLCDLIMSIQIYLDMKGVHHKYLDDEAFS